MAIAGVAGGDQSSTALVLVAETALVLVGETKVVSTSNRNGGDSYNGGPAEDTVRAHSPPPTGYETPSDPGTPFRDGGTQLQTFGHGQSNEAAGADLMCIDRWDWKTDAPEFVPGGGMESMMSVSQDQPVVQSGAFQNAWAMTGAHLGGDAISQGPGVDSESQIRLMQLRSQYEWQMRSKVDELREMQARINQLEIDTQQARTAMDGEKQKLVRQIGCYRTVFERYCIPPEEASTVCFNGPEDAAEEGYLGGAFEPATSSQWHNSPVAVDVGQPGLQPQGPLGHLGDGLAGLAALGFGTEGAGRCGGDEEEHDSSLDFKMRQLNSLLQGGAPPSGPTRASPDSHLPDAGWQDDSGRDPEGRDREDPSYTSGAIASTLQAMFPHATIRTGRTDLEKAEASRSQHQAFGDHADSQSGVSGRKAAIQADVEAHMRRLERSVGSMVDDRALVSLQTLDPADACEALRKVEELVQSQGGQCRNLSSILQSVCRKLEKKSTKPLRAEDEARYMASWGATAGDGPHGRGSLRARREDEEGDAFAESSGSDGGLAQVVSGVASASKGAPARATALQSPTGSNLDTPAGKKSWADIGDNEDDGDEDPWTPSHLEQLADKGLELRALGDKKSVFRISMANLSPPMTDAGLERYCSWLRARLTAFREEHGPESLRSCQGEVDFSQNNMTNQMVWILLETLAQNEVHVAFLKLNANNISQGGALAVCEFINMNEVAEAVQEIHLSHNEIDDESALELLRTLHSMRPRYPPLRAPEDKGERVPTPVWLRLNHNRIENPEEVRRTAEAEGISICTASDRQACGTTTCCDQTSGVACPLVHLFSFNVQQQNADEEASKDDGVDSRGQRRKRDKKRDKI
eukprot:CAMPEP_0115124902 /NCGR_PEP_ID=MMETSP0227-20121206/48651_1 /TAXON_ID=89957 /ORGANISM="Polarella glacialis, Strain CCMP 1383" /LENGTH=862 /DNA_ID=CAMNT_0002528027 /DNA_START=179 /DNA_END=2767 /DNA_ORIENTATION=-